MQCSYEAWVNPAFKLHKSRIDRSTMNVLRSPRRIADLQDTLSHLEHVFQDTDARLQSVLEENIKLSKERDLLALTSKKFARDLAKGLEKYILTKLFNPAFALLPEDVKHDEEFMKRFLYYSSFLHKKNYKISICSRLQEICLYLNYCKVINNLLINASITSKDNLPGADDFLPVLIYVNIKSTMDVFEETLVCEKSYGSQQRCANENE
ncbi:hypothetical protein J5N97_028179 [Dioscorea zingiberensis]|uniref:Uncharacterized protein n=1 Tax=Dioscorea zingiberensis TaxID=325984 RepID=A0A9D5BZ27_9LILI|nr:hypothetical protein J5N97_028179 [Dioscorea zingiberensis]